MSTIKELQINGRIFPADVESDRSLLSVLRDDLDLTGSKYGCGEGQCGACTVLLDGVPTRSCLTPVGKVGEKKITTIEGVARGGNLHPVQEALLNADALQCGYCTSGMVMAGFALLEKNPKPSDDEILRALNGHICRCGTYQRILAAIKQASDKVQQGAQ